MNRKRFLVGLHFWFLILSSCITTPVAFADPVDYLQLLRNDLNKIAADYSASDNRANCSQLQSQPEKQPTAGVTDFTTSKSATAVQTSSSSGAITPTNYANPPSNYTAGRVGREGDPNSYNKNPITSKHSFSDNGAAKNGLIKTNNSKKLSDAAYLETFIAESKKSSLGYYYKILNPGEGSNACSGKVTFRLVESTVSTVKDEDNFTLNCKDLPAILADSLSKIKKNGQIELLTSAYQIYKEQVTENGYQANSLIKFNIKSLN